MCNIIIECDDRLVGAADKLVGVHCKFVAFACRGGYDAPRRLVGERLARDLVRLVGRTNAWDITFSQSSYWT